MKATKIKMRYGCGSSNSLTEIDKIYLEDCTNPGYYSKETVHDYLKSNPYTIQVNISPYPYLQPAVSQNGEKYVKSKPDYTGKDNLLNLPRE